MLIFLNKAINDIFEQRNREFIEDKIEISKQPQLLKKKFEIKD